jgi:predicted O-linked N-acetylglucosamine transferase (SPINDLY family)
VENGADNRINRMTAPLQDALQRYKSGDFHGLLRRHAAAAAQSGCPQVLLVLVAQSHLRTGHELKAAEHYRLAGEARGENHLNYLLIAGNLFIRLSRLEEAHSIARQVIAMAPADPRALEFHHRTVQETCLFEEIEQTETRLRARLEQGDARYLGADNPFCNISWCDDEAINACLVSSAVARPVNAEMRRARHARPHKWSDRLRIGYLSDDYYDTHATMHLFQGVMMSHDVKRFDITHFCFTGAANVARDQGMRSKYPNLVQIGHMGDEAAAEFIRSREIDILVDLKGHTQGSRPNLVNLGLAPVQAAYLGFPGSANGVDCDYVIGDRIVTPDSSKPHYHEKFCRLPESYQANDNVFRPRPAPLSRAELGLPEDRVILGFFNATRKITPHTFRLIVEILKGSAGTVLWILFFNRFAEKNFIAAAVRQGIDPARIISAPKALYTNHLARLPAVDVALDSFPYNGHTTTSDLLWAGVPVPTCRGRHFASRVSESLLAALGVSELVADDADGYIALVRELVSNKAMREAIRAKIVAQRSTAPLFDTGRFTRHLERAFEMMAERARRGLPPDHIDVPVLPGDTQ